MRFLVIFTLIISMTHITSYAETKADFHKVFPVDWIRSVDLTSPSTAPPITAQWSISNEHIDIFREHRKSKITYQDSTIDFRFGKLRGYDDWVIDGIGYKNFSRKKLRSIFKNLSETFGDPENVIDTSNSFPVYNDDKSSVLFKMDTESKTASWLIGNNRLFVSYTSELAGKKSILEIIKLRIRSSKYQKAVRDIQWIKMITNRNNSNLVVGLDFNNNYVLRITQSFLGKIEQVTESEIVFSWKSEDVTNTLTINRYYGTYKWLFSRSNQTIHEESGKIELLLNRPQKKL